MAQMAARLRRYAYAERVKCAVADAAAAAKRGDAKFDLILCDVPCSGTGTLARNPEIRHRLRAEDLARQAARQSAILRGALRRLAPGGRLVYSTCSLEAEENEQVVEAVAQRLDAADSGGAADGKAGGDWRVEAGCGRGADWHGGAGWRAAHAARGAWVRWIFCGGAGAG